MIEKLEQPILKFSEFTTSFERKMLGEVADIYDGTHQTPKYVDAGIPFVSVENIDDITNTDKFISPEAFEKDFKIKPKKGDILMTRITAGVIGATAIVLKDDPLAYYVSLALIRVKMRGVDAHYLEHYISTPYFKRELHRRIIHIAFPKKINLGEINKCLVSLPEYLEQQKIASFLSAIDQRINLLQQKRYTLERYKKGVMQKLFSQEIRFKDEDGNDFPDWEEKRLGEISFKSASNISANSLEDENGDYKIYGATGHLQNVSFYREKEEYISIVKDGAGAGRVMKCEAKSSVLGTLDIIKPKEKNDLIFLFYLLYNLRFEKYITGSTIPHIYYKDYSKERLLIPCFKEQKKIAEFLDSLQSVIDKIEEKRLASIRYKKGLLQKMFV